MTELMKQLQQWANEKRYDFAGKRFRTPYGWIDNFHPQSSQLTRLWWDYSYQIKFDVLQAIPLVLDGTIQVWRPVEHYPPPEKTEVLALFFISENAGYEHGIVETNVYKDFTHWQPLPQPPQKGGK